MASDYPDAGHAGRQTRPDISNCLQWFRANAEAIISVRYSSATDQSVPREPEYDDDPTGTRSANNAEHSTSAWPFRRDTRCNIDQLQGDRTTARGFALRESTGNQDGAGS
jgi:hypothetical protein